MWIQPGDYFNGKMVVDGCAPNKAIAERKSESGDSGGIVQYIALTRLTRPRAVLSISPNKYVFRLVCVHKVHTFDLYSRLKNQ